MSISIEDLNPQIMELVPGVKQQDLMNLLRIREERKSKFDAASFSTRPGHIAHDIALAYARSYKGSFEFMQDMKKNANTGRLKLTMTAGIINALWNDITSIRIRRAPDVPIVEQPTERVIEDGLYPPFEITTRPSPLRSTQIVALLIDKPGAETRKVNIGFLKGDRYVPFSAYSGEKFRPWHNAIEELIKQVKEGARAMDGGKGLYGRSAS